MKKLLLFIFSVALISGAATAQTAKQEEKKELKETIKDKKVHQKAVVKDAAHLNLGTAKEQHDKAEADRKSQHVIAKDLRAKGVEHPVVKAKKAIRKEHEAAEKKKDN